MLLEESGSELEKKGISEAFIQNFSECEGLWDIYAAYMCPYCGKYFDSCPVSI